MEIRPGVIAVDGIGKGRCQHAKVCGRPAPWRADVERHHVLVIPAPDACRVESRSHAVRDFKGEIGLPAEVVDVVVVKVDGAILYRRVFPGHFLAGPPGTGHGAGRQVDQAAVQTLRPNVHDPRRTRVPGEVPQGPRAGMVADFVFLVVDFFHRHVDEGRCFDLAVEMALDGVSVHPADGDPVKIAQGNRADGRDRDIGRTRWCVDRPESHAHGPATGIVARPHPVPLPGLDRCASANGAGHLVRR